MPPRPSPHGVMLVLNLAAPLFMAVDSSDSESGSMNFFEWLFHSNGFHAPSTKDFAPAALLFDGTIFEFNRITLVRIIAAVALIAIVAVILRQPKVVPGRAQAGFEMIVDFVRVDIAESVMGKKDGHRYAMILTTLFLAIFAFNITGILPFLNIAGTSVIGLPIVMALWVYILYLTAGIKEHGLGGFLKSNLFPPGLPKLVYVLLTPIEFLQIFILRPATLALRLTANMMAGHLLLVLTFAASHYFFLEAAGFMKAFGVVSFAAGAAFTLFEIFVALLQAYVFTILTAVYLNLSLSHEH